LCAIFPRYISPENEPFHWAGIPTSIFLVAEVFMNIQNSLARVLMIVGLAAMLLGAIDPLEGSFVILPGCAAVTLGAYLGKSHWRVILASALVLIVAGVGAMVVFTAMGGIGGDSGHSAWWGLFVLPYPLGWIMGLVGAVLSLIESFKRGKTCRTEM
jgi:hypothetical protein